MSISPSTIKVDIHLYNPHSDAEMKADISLPPDLSSSNLIEQAQPSFDIPSHLNFSIGYYCHDHKLKIWDLHNQGWLDIMIRSTSPDCALRVDDDIEERGAGERWLIEKARNVRVEIRRKDAAPVVIGFEKNIVEWMKDGGDLTMVVRRRD